MKLKVNRKAATENYFEFDKRARTLKRNCVRLHSVYLLGKYFLSSVCAKYDFNFLNLLILQSIVQNCRQKLTNLRSRPNGDRDYFFIKWANPGLFFVYFRSFKQTLFFYNKSMWKNVMSIQYTAPGFEPTTFGMRVSSHNH